MKQEADLVLIGTGLAPLMVAVDLLSSGKRVMLLNPASDFFAENSELPFPLLRSMQPEAWLQADAAGAYELLSPFYPGAIELWTPHKESLEQGFYDPLAPHLRSRQFLMLKEFPEDREVEEFERLGAALRKKGVPSKTHEGLAALKRFPGFSGKGVDLEAARALSIPQIYDLDLERYRQGVLELVWDRLGEESIFLDVNNLHFESDEIRFYSGGKLMNLRFEERVIAFWTPRIARQFQAFAHLVPKPKATTTLEQWDLISRDPVDPGVIGIYGDAFVWGNYQGAPSEDHRPTASSSQHSLSVLLHHDVQKPTDPSDLGFLSEASFIGLSKICKDFMKWDKYSVRSISPRLIFEWEEKDKGLFPIPGSDERYWVATACDGDALEIGKTARRTLEALP